MVGEPSGRRDEEWEGRRLRQVLEQLSDAFVVVDRDFNFVYANPVALRMVGRTIDEVVGRNHWELLPQLKDTIVWDEYHRALETGKPSVFEYRSPLRGKWLEARVFPTEEGLTFYLTDVTERHQAQRMLRDTTDGVPALIAYLDSDLVYRFCNAAYETYMGQPPSEFVGRYIGDLAAKPVFEMIEPRMRRALTGEEVRYTSWVNYPGMGRRFVRVSYRPDFGPDGQVRGLYVLVLDETEPQLAEEALRESEERLAAAVRVAGLGIWDFDPATDAATFDERCREVFGFPMDVPLTRWQVEERIHPDDVAEVQRRIAGALDPQSGGEYEAEYRVIRPDGTVRWVVVRASSVFQEEGATPRFGRFVGTLFDLTERKEMEAELERRVAERTRDLNAALEQMQTFTYHVSHDLRAPLRAIVSTSRIVQEDFAADLPEGARRQLDRQAEAARRLGVLIDDLLKLSRLSREEIERRPLDLSAIARECGEDALGQHVGSTVTIEVEEGLVAEADARLIKLALLNLIENAVKYSPSGGRVRVGRRPDGPFFVADEGIGMDPRFLSKIFEPFQRLHRDDEFAGTGIGLANVRQALERHGGRVWAESELGRGSVFYFTLS